MTPKWIHEDPELNARWKAGYQTCAFHYTTVVILVGGLFYYFGDAMAQFSQNLFK